MDRREDESGRQHQVAAWLDVNIVEITSVSCLVRYAPDRNALDGFEHPRT